MAWAFVGVSTAVTVTATSHTLTLPAGTQAGDLLVAVISSRIASTTSITLPAGWALVAESKTNNVVAAATTSEASGMMAYIVRGASAPALTFTHPTAPSVAMGQIVAYRGNHPTPFDVGIGAKTGTAITAVSTTGLTTGSANELIVKGVCSGRASAFSAHDAATDPTTSSATGSVQTAAPIVGTWQERQDASTTTGADTGLAIADAIRGTAGATGALTCTASVSGGHAQVAGAFKIGKLVTFASNRTNTVASPLTVTIPATVAGDCIIYVGGASLSSGLITVQANTGAAGVHGTIAGMQSPRGSNSPSPQFAFVVGIIAAPAAGTTSVSLSCANDILEKELGVWVVRGLTNPVQGKGIFLKYQIANPRISGLTGPLAAADEFIVSYSIAFEESNTAIDLTPTGASGFILDLVPSSLFGSGFSHQETSATTQVQAGWTLSGGSGDVVLASYRSTPPVVTTYPAATVVGFSARQLWDTGLSLDYPSFTPTQAGDCIIYAGITDSIAAIDIRTPTNEVGVFGTLGGVTSPVSNGARYHFVGIIANPAVGTTSIRLSTTDSANKVLAAWVVRGLPNPTQDKGVWTAATDVPVALSGLSGTLAASNEFAVTCALPPNQVYAVNLEQTGSAEFLTDTLYPFFDGGFGHAVTQDTTSIQAAWNSSTGGADVTLATYRADTGPISQTGPIHVFSISDAASASNTGTVSTTITVPTDAELIVVGWSGQPPASPDGFFSGGVMKFTKGGVDTNMVSTPGLSSDVGGLQSAPLFYMALPDTGTNKTLKWDWSGSGAPPGTGAVCSITFWKGVDTASPVRDIDGGGDNTIPFTIPSVTTQSDDLVLGWAGFYDNGAEQNVTAWNNLNTLANLPCSSINDAAWGIRRATGTSLVTGITSASYFNGALTTIVLKPAATGFTGTLATTEGADVAAMTGNVTRIANLATTEAADTALINATVRWAATLAETEDPDVALINATVRWAATLAEIEDADVAALVGTVRWSGPLAVTEAPDVALINATVVEPLTGTLATTEAPDVAALVGTISWQATLATTEAPDALAFLGVTRWAVTLATTEAPDVALINAAVRWAATLATTEAPDVAAFTGTTQWVATLAAIEAPDVALFNGIVRDPISATLATIEPADVAAFTGVVYVPVAGTLGAIEPADGAAFTGGVQVAGTLGALEAPDVAALIGTTRWAATLATTEAADLAAFLGATRWVATLATTELPDTAALVGTARWSATLATTEAPDTAALTGTVRWAAVLSTTEAADAAAFLGGIYASGPLAVTEGPDVGAFIGGIYATGTLAASEAPDVYSGLGTVFGAGVGGNLATTEAADVAAFTGQITGVAGLLAALEPVDPVAFTGTTRWIATLSTREAADAAAFLVTSSWLATLVTTEARDTAAMLGNVQWVTALATREAADSAAFTGVAGALPSGVVLDAREAPDVGAFTGATLSTIALAATEAPDLAAFTGGIFADGILNTTEAPDRALFTAQPPDIAEIPGRILASDPRRVRELASHEPRLRILAPNNSPTRDLSRGSKRVRSLKYPIPRTHMLVKMLNSQTLTGD